MHARRREWHRDVALALAVALAVVSITSNIPPADGERSLDAVGYATMLVAAGSLALVRRAAILVLVVVAAALMLYTARTYPGGPVYLCYPVPLFALGAQRGWRGALAPVAVTTTAFGLIGILFGPDDNTMVFHLLVLPGWATAAVLLGDAKRARGERVRSLEERARMAEETREEEARRRVAEERLRIARDLHDVIAHGIAAISLQSGVAAHVLDRQPEQVAEALRAIRRTSTETLHELRATLDVLRADGDDEAPRAPTPGLDRLDGLIETARRSGVDVELRVEGDPAPVPAAVDLAAYRIAQESLTNVMRHAHATGAVVTVRHLTGAVEVEVTDDGRGAAAAGTSGHGIAGMRERATLVGGTLDVGPRPGGGFRVCANLPVVDELEPR